MKFFEQYPIAQERPAAKFFTEGIDLNSRTSQRLGISGPDDGLIESIAGGLNDKGPLIILKSRVLSGNSSFIEKPLEKWRDFLDCYC